MGKQVNRYLGHQEFFKKFPANHFTLSDADGNTSSQLNGGGIYSRFIFTENITQPTITCSKLTIETLEQGVKYVQS